jgi:hypothetical protein
VADKPSEQAICLCRYAGPLTELMLLAFMSSEFIPLFCNHNHVTNCFPLSLYDIAQLLFYFFLKKADGVPRGEKKRRSRTPTENGWIPPKVNEKFVRSFRVSDFDLPSCMPVRHSETRVNFKKKQLT